MINKWTTLDCLVISVKQEDKAREGVGVDTG